MAIDGEGQSPWTDGAAAQFEGKQMSQYFDPCQEAAQRSFKCLQRNDGDKTMCSDYFDAYKACKKRWQEERKEARRKAGKWF